VLVEAVGVVGVVARHVSLAFHLAISANAERTKISLYI
jgi:hypothetical protein